MIPENEKYYRNAEKITKDVIDDFHDFLEIASEFKSNQYLREFHDKVVSDTCRKYLKAPESLYVLTIRKLVDTVQDLTLKLDKDDIYASMVHYKLLYEETFRKWEQVEKDLEDISKIINRGDTVG